MGSPIPRETPDLSSAAQTAAAPETLARLVLRCRELSAFLDGALAKLPARDETPFLYGQLDDVLQRLHANLRQVPATDGGGADKGASFLRRLAGKKPREAAPKKSEPRYDLQGNAWTIPVTELVGFLSHSGKSGLLWVTTPSETFVLEFSRGNLVHATSNAPPVAFRLGEILLEEELLTPAELADVIDYAKAADDLLGSYLVRTGRLQHSDLQRALAVQVQQLFHRLMDADNALYRFQEGAQLLRSQSLEVNITHLLLESARKKDEERCAADEEKRKEAAREAAEQEAAEQSEARGAPAKAEPAPRQAAEARAPAARNAPAANHHGAPPAKPAEAKPAPAAATRPAETRADEKRDAQPAAPAKVQSEPAAPLPKDDAEAETADSGTTPAAGEGASAGD